MVGRQQGERRRIEARAERLPRRAVKAGDATGGDATGQVEISTYDQLVIEYPQCPHAAVHAALKSAPSPVLPLRDANRRDAARVLEGTASDQCIVVNRQR